MTIEFFRNTQNGIFVLLKFENKLGIIVSDTKLNSFNFCHNSHLIRQIQQNKIYKKFIKLTRD